MRMSITVSDINEAVLRSGLQGYTGTYQELGGGEVNDSVVLNLESGPVVLRLCRYDEFDHLHREATALGLLDSPSVPRVVYFDAADKINGKAWILESYVTGTKPGHLTIPQFASLGRLLARIHSVKAKYAEQADFWQDFVYSSKHFGTEQELIGHPDERLRGLIKKAKPVFDAASHAAGTITPTLAHLDPTPGNILVDGDEVKLIDWEFSRFKDPMADFAAGYYDDMELNQGKWRARLAPPERQALFDGYESAGGTIDHARLTTWVTLDKLKAATFLYWRLRQAKRTDTPAQTAQYEQDFAALLGSLESRLTIHPQHS